MNIGGTEVILILVVALLLFGAKNLPKIARSMGKSVEEFRRAAREVSREVMLADQPDPPSPTPAPHQVASGSPAGPEYPQESFDEGPAAPAAEQTAASDVPAAPAAPAEVSAPAPAPAADVAQVTQRAETQKESPDEGRG
jgi:sec-independent protein translocase protein TatA